MFDQNNLALFNAQWPICCRLNFERATDQMDDTAAVAMFLLLVDPGAQATGVTRHFQIR